MSGLMRLVCLLAVTVLACEGKPPNIVFMVADDLGWNDVSWHNPGIKTPNLEHLAKTGIILNQSYVQPVCTPSRSAWMSGYYPFHTGLQHGVILIPQPKGLPLNVTTLPQHLKQAGYSTHIVGKWHLGFCKWNYTPTYRGFDSFFGYYSGAEDHWAHDRSFGPLHGVDLRENEDPARGYNGTFSTDMFTKHAVNVIRSHNKSSPLFLYMPFQNVHAPLQVPKPYEDLYKNIHNKDRRVYSGMVTKLDEAVGNITSALKQSGLYEDTIILFTTDNGGIPFHGGNNWPLRGGKATLWEGGTRGVGFIHSPLLKNRGYVYDGLVHVSDWFPSILSIASLKTRENIDGMSFWENVINNKKSARNSLVYNIDELNKNGAIREGNYKLLVGNPGYDKWYPVPTYAASYGSDLNPDSPKFGSLEPSIENWNFTDVKLFDLSTDPTEHHDLKSERPDIVESMTQTFKNHLKTLVPSQSQAIDPIKSNPKRFGGYWSPGWC